MNTDRRFWVHDLKKTYFGDTDLNGEFGSSDMIDTFLAGEYEDTVAGNSLWEEGDWNGDAEFTSSDMITAFLDMVEDQQWAKACGDCRSRTKLAVSLAAGFAGMARLSASAVVLSLACLSETTAISPLRNPKRQRGKNLRSFSRAMRFPSLTLRVTMFAAFLSVDAQSDVEMCEALELTIRLTMIRLT